MAGGPKNLIMRFYPEAKFGGFSRVDRTLEFYSRIAALLNPTDVVLDYGAGRGAQIETDSSPYLRGLKTLRGRVAHLEGCDVDPAVLENPYLDHAQVIDPTKPLPYEDGQFNLIYSNWVFEHVDDPDVASRELLRVVKPGGYICAVTPNKWGYVAMAARIAGNSNHVPLLRKIQPARLEVDVFPTRYRLNTLRAIRRHFGRHAEVVVYGSSSEPAYHFGSAAMFRMLMFLHRLLPQQLDSTLLIFMQKRG